jgi:transposase
VLGYADEVWWSRLAQPALHAWTAGADESPLRLVERAADKADPDPKAVACYGLLRRDTDEMMLRFVAGRPVSHVTTQFLAWACEDLAADGKKALLLVWDNASWHVSKEVRSWVRDHNRAAKRGGGVRVVVCQLPVKAPWLNPIEPKWAHGKRAVVEPDRTLTASELKQRICQYYGCPEMQPLEQKVA